MAYLSYDLSFPYECGTEWRILFRFSISSVCICSVLHCKCLQQDSVSRRSEVNLRGWEDEVMGDLIWFDWCWGCCGWLRVFFLWNVACFIYYSAPIPNHVTKMRQNIWNGTQGLCQQPEVWKRGGVIVGTVSAIYILFGFIYWQFTYFFLV